MGQWIHYSLIILFSVGALIAFIFSWWGKKFDWSEEASKTLFMDDPEEKI